MGLLRQIFVASLTMFLCGLWHGAGWNFVLWGIYHGLGLGFYALWKKYGIKTPFVLGWFITIVFIILGWVLFRSPNLSAALSYYKVMFTFSDTSFHIASAFKEGLTVIAVILVLAFPTSYRLAHWLPKKKALAVFLGIFAAILILEVGKGQYQEFIYFEF
jgi:D-alanyl-lipoteichoic acid acyltransferase DltB (MBOAT superfamily)